MRDRLGNGHDPGNGRFTRKELRDNVVDLGDPDFDELLEGAATLQELVPDAVLVGGSAAAIHVGHRVSFDHDHDHVIGDLRTRFDMVLDALEREEEWVTNRVTPGKIILGELGGIEAGVRQLIRARPLEIEERTVPSGARLRVPTFDETLRIKAYLIVKRNQVRDYLDVAALSAAQGTSHAAQVLATIDDYYQDRDPQELRVAGQVADQFYDPAPADAKTTRHLAQYKKIDPKWQDWSRVTAVCQEVAMKMLGLDG